MQNCIQDYSKSKIYFVSTLRTKLIFAKKVNVFFTYFLSRGGGREKNKNTLYLQQSQMSRFVFSIENTQIDNILEYIYQVLPFYISIKLTYSWFHKKGTWSVHSFNEGYISIPWCTGSCGYLFHETPCFSMLFVFLIIKQYYSTQCIFIQIQDE